MSRKKLKTKKKPHGAEEGGLSWLSEMEPESRTRLLRAALWVTVVCAVAVGIGAGLDRLETSVHALDRYDGQLTLQWENLPDWLKLRHNRHILNRLTRQAGLTSEDRRLDPNLAERLGRSLSDPEIGWIKSVERITVRPNGVVSVRCRFRRPSAWVRHGKYCYLVDEDGGRLPGRYALSDCADGSLLLIDGVRRAPPTVGSIWRGAELSVGLKLVSLLAEKPFRHQIARVIVENHGGRVDRSRPHIELATDRPGSRIWWGRPPDEEFGTEITANQKLTLLQTLYRQWGRIDMNRAYVNIMTWPDKIAMPASKPSPKSARLLRG